MLFFLSIATKYIFYNFSIYPITLPIRLGPAEPSTMYQTVAVARTGQYFQSFDHQIVFFFFDEFSF